MKKGSCGIERVVRGQQVVDGAGVRINRLIGTWDLEHIDPFVLLDEIRSDDPDDYIAGFPMHPHRGIETITYMIKGNFRHRDSRGGGGLLTDGCVQWMTAGRGIQHSEMPEKVNGELWGYQLWLNLPRRHKMVDPRYQHLSPDMILRHREEGLEVGVISGSYRGVEGRASNWVRSEYFDVRLSGGGVFSHPVESGASCFGYVHSGEAAICGESVPAGSLVSFTEGAGVEIRPEGEAGLLFLTGTPNREPIVRGGPFVMNTEEEIRQAFEDYREGRLF